MHILHLLASPHLVLGTRRRSPPGTGHQEKVPTWYWAPGEGDLKDLICVQEVCIVRGHRCARSCHTLKWVWLLGVISPTLSLPCHCHDITPVKTMTSPCLLLQVLCWILSCVHSFLPSLTAICKGLSKPFGNYFVALIHYHMQKLFTKPLTAVLTEKNLMEKLFIQCLGSHYLWCTTCVLFAARERGSSSHRRLHSSMGLDKMKLCTRVHGDAFIVIGMKMMSS